MFLDLRNDDNTCVAAVCNYTWSHGLLTWSGISQLIHGSEYKQEVSGLELPTTLAYAVVNVVDKDHRVHYEYSTPWKHFVRWHLSDESSAKQWELSVRQWDCLHHCLHIDWLYVVGPDENNRQPSTYELTLWKKSCHWKSGRRVWHCNQWMWRDLNTNKTNLIIGSIAWNHTLANVVLKLSFLRQRYLLLKLFSPLLFPFLCLCEVQLNTSLRPARSFTQDHYWWMRSEWLSERVHKGYRIFIYYPSHILMQPLCSKKGISSIHFMGNLQKRWHCKRVGRSD